MIEKDIQRQVITEIKKKGWLVFKAGPIVKGFPDLICLKGNIFVLIEMKRPGKEEIRLYQGMFKAMLAKVGITVHIVNCLEDLAKIEEFNVV